MTQLEAKAAETRATHALILRNTLYLVVAKVLSTPLSILMNAMIARYLGPAAYSDAYLATTYVGFGGLVIAFGQQGTLPAAVARDRSRAGVYLGSALAWRLVSSVVVYAVLVGGCYALGYPTDFQIVLAIVMAASTFVMIRSAFEDTIRGFERTDVDAFTGVGGPLLALCVIVPILLLGGRLKAVLLGDMILSLIGAVVVSRFLRPVGVGPVSFDRNVVKELLVKGYPFFFFGLAMALQPSIDAAFLSKLAPAEVVGWHAAARKLVGLLVFPAGALIAALYPVLCRLYTHDRAAYIDTAGSVIRTSLVLVVPAAFGCGLFPEIGVMILGADAYGPAADNLRIFALFIFLVYFSMPVGSVLLAGGQARAWSIVQGVCVITSLVLDPILIPWFQSNTGNGGLGVCVSTAVSEVFMVGLGIWLLPSGVIDRRILKVLFSVAVSGGAMTLAAWLLSDTNVFLVAPFALIVYAVSAWATGGFSKDQLRTIGDVLRRKVGR